jgi:hypothetical protein
MIMFGFAGRPKSFIRKPYEAEKNTASHRNSQDDSITMTITSTIVCDGRCYTRTCTSPVRASEITTIARHVLATYMIHIAIFVDVASAISTIVIAGATTSAAFID